MVPNNQPDQEPIAIGEGAFAVPQAHRAVVLEGFGEAERGQFRERRGNGGALETVWP
jgi:hypothetical protein